MDDSIQPGLFSPVEILGTSRSLRIDKNDLRVMIGRLYFSKYYKFQYIFIICLCIGSAMILFHLSDPYQIWFYLLESLMVLIVTADLVCQGIVQDLKNFKVIIDLCVSVSILVLMILGLSISSTTVLLIALTLIMLKNLYQYFKLYILIRNMGNVEISVIDMNEMSEIDRNQDLNRSGILISKDDLCVLSSKKGQNSNHDMHSSRIVHSLGN